MFWRDLPGVSCLSKHPRLAVTADQIKRPFSRVETQSKPLSRQPLLVLNVVLAFLQDGKHAYAEWRRELLKIEAQLGVPHDLAGLQSLGYFSVSYDFNKISADLAVVVKGVAEIELAVVTIMEHAKGFQRLADLSEKTEMASTKHGIAEVG
ncbi:hypothetical protein BDV29DRAFT_160745 [Aspergillus leporis]|uniref:Uncharacterized protein n=1 Tax=Aspergillus leporis TaxID=41062 RepID=A0A5N5WSN0_9EURO|nr:hypothetical protein BDV29DRAFT_160745 [Aspergillus leporis]